MIEMKRYGWRAQDKMLSWFSLMRIKFCFAVNILKFWIYKLHCYCTERTTFQAPTRVQCEFLSHSKPKRSGFSVLSYEHSRLDRVRQREAEKKKRQIIVFILFGAFFVPAHTLSIRVVNSKQSWSANFMLHSKTFFSFSPNDIETNKNIIAAFIFLLWR